MNEIKVQSMSDPSFGKFGVLLTTDRGETKCDTPVVTHVHGIGSLETLGPDPVIAYVKAYRREDFIVDKVERHVNTSEIFFPKSGTAIMVFMGDGPEGGPDPNTAEAYLIEPGCPFISNKSVWHWVPYPIGDEWDTFIIIEDNLIENDIEVLDLETSVKITL